MKMNLKEQYNDSLKWGYKNLWYAYDRPSMNKVYFYDRIVKDYDRMVDEGAWVSHGDVRIASKNTFIFTTITQIFKVGDEKTGEVIEGYIKETPSRTYVEWYNLDGTITRH